MTRPLQPWLPGDVILASRLDEMTKEIKAARNWQVRGSPYRKTKDGHQMLIRSAASCGFLCISKNATTATTIDVSAGYACYAGTFTELSDGTDTITGYSGADGSWYASAKIDFATGTWTLVKSATVNVLPVNTDSVQHYVLGKVTVASAVITAVQQYWAGGWCIYENRV